VKIDRVCGVILWDPPERPDDAEWDAFVAPYITTARRYSVMLRAQVIRAVEKNFEVFENHAAIVLPEIKRIEDANTTDSEVRELFQGITVLRSRD
jgi:hypothetical protein